MYDLNVPWPVNNYTTKPSPAELANLKNTITTLYSVGYTHIVINFVIPETVKIPVNSPELANPIDIAMLSKDLAKFPQLKLFTRLTLVVNDPAKCQGLSKIQNTFDILAVQPLSERALQLCSTNLDIDLISFNFTSKLPFFLKHKPVGSAVERGIKFEIQYAHVTGSSDSQSRKSFFSNVVLLIRSSRSRGLVISSGATSPLEVRNASDVLILLKTLGLDNSRSKACVTITPERVLVNGRLRLKSYKQTVMVGNDLMEKSDITKKRLDDTSSGRLLKRQRQQ